jgi:glycosyltransferase involved in cell wall biosynthesis
VRLALISAYPAAGSLPRGGVEASAWRLSRALVAAGADVTVVAPGPRGDLRSDGVDVVYAGPIDQPLSLIRALRPWRRAAATALNALQPELVHGHGLLAAGLAATDVKRPTPRIVTAHGNPVRDLLALRDGFGPRLRAAAVGRMMETTAARADAVVSVHPDWRVNLRRPVADFAYIPNIVDSRFFAPAGRSDERVVVYVGGELRVKGGDVLAAAWPLVRRKVADARLVLVGWSTPVEPRWPSDGSVTAIPVAGHDRVQEAFAEASVVVIPSRYEVAPLALYEAWAMERLVVATGVGGIPSLADGAALIVPPEDPGALADGLVDALREPEAFEAERVRGSERAGRARAADVARAHIELYERLLRERRR